MFPSSGTYKIFEAAIYNSNRLAQNTIDTGLLKI
jgi:hypothetical protein